jgi:hypothetical protein
VEYVVVTPAVTANEIKICVVPDSEQHCKATITYRRSALTPDGNAEGRQTGRTLGGGTADSLANGHQRSTGEGWRAMTDVELARALERGEIANEDFHHASHFARSVGLFSPNPHQVQQAAEQDARYAAPIRRSGLANRENTTRP